MPVEYSEDQIKKVVAFKEKQSRINREISDRHEHWSITKKHITDCLEAIKKRLALTDTYNLASPRELQFTFGKTNSGFTNGEGESASILTKIGGCLIYRQLYNGKIKVLIGLPYIDRIRPQQSLIEIAVLGPRDISQQLVAEHFEAFLEKITDWEEEDE